MIKFLLVVNRQGKVRLHKWYTTHSLKERERIIREVSNIVLKRPTTVSNFIEWRDSTIVYRRYANLYFMTCIDKGDNELLALETIHRYVVILDKYFGSVSEIDIIFDFARAYVVLDEVINAGEIIEAGPQIVLNEIEQQDELHRSDLEKK